MNRMHESNPVVLTLNLLPAHAPLLFIIIMIVLNPMVVGIYQKKKKLIKLTTVVSKLLMITDLQYIIISKLLAIVLASIEKSYIYIYRYVYISTCGNVYQLIIYVLVNCHYNKNKFL